MKWDLFRKKRPEPLKGLSAGLIGGAMGSLAMTCFQKTWTEVKEEMEERDAKMIRARQGQPSDRSHIRMGSHFASQSNESGKYRDATETGGGPSGQGEPSTVKTASVISEKVFRHHLTQREKKIAGPAVHYTYGTLIGGTYGLAAEYVPEITVAGGSVFGAGLTVASDEVMIPALRLGPPPHRTPPSMHLYALASHVVFGISTELTRRAARKLMDGR